MHSTARRLLEIGKEQGAKDFVEIARRLGASDQTATNWKTRGVAKAAIIKASKTYGVSVTYLQDGTLPKFIAASDSPPAPPVQNQYARVLEDLAALHEDDAAAWAAQIKAAANKTRREKAIADARLAELESKINAPPAAVSVPNKETSDLSRSQEARRKGANQ